MTSKKARAGVHLKAYGNGVVDIFWVSAFTATDAKRILSVTSKKPRLSPQETADRLNWAVTGAIAGMSIRLAEPASKRRTRASMLQAALQQALNLLGVDVKAGPDARAFASACSALLPAGETSQIASTCAKLGFPSPTEAISRGIASLWLFQHCAVAARRHWEARPEKVKHPADPFVSAWATAMRDAYEDVVEAEKPNFPTGESPFIKFCDEVRAHVIQRLPESGEPALEAFRATLQKIRRPTLATFVTRHLNSSPTRIRTSKRSNSTMRIRNQSRSN